MRFSYIASSLTKLNQKKEKSQWLEKYDQSFQTLKDHLTLALMSTLSEGLDGFLVYYDALCVRLGCVLMQHDKIIAYDSTKHKVNGRNYVTHDLELVAVVFGLKIQRHYLYGVYDDIFTNHKILQQVINQKDLNHWEK